MKRTARPASEILVVDDDPPVRNLLVDVLAGSGYRVQTARDGQEALERLAEQPPHLILLDLLLPRLDGWSFRVRQLALAGLATIPVAVLSLAYDAQRAGRDLRATALLPKPFDLDHLLGLVGQLTGSPSCQQPLDPAPQLPIIGLHNLLYANLVAIWDERG